MTYPKMHAGKAQITVYLEGGEVEALDGARGDKSRSGFVADALRSVLTKQKAK